VNRCIECVWLDVVHVGVLSIHGNIAVCTSYSTRKLRRIHYVAVQSSINKNGRSVSIVTRVFFTRNHTNTRTQSSVFLRRVLLWYIHYYLVNS